MELIGHSDLWSSFHQWECGAGESQFASLILRVRKAELVGLDAMASNRS